MINVMFLVFFKQHKYFHFKLTPSAPSRVDPGTKCQLLSDLEWSLKVIMIFNKKTLVLATATPLSSVRYFWPPLSPKWIPVKADTGPRQTIFFNISGKKLRKRIWWIHLSSKWEWSVPALNYSPFMI